MRNVAKDPFKKDKGSGELPLIRNQSHQVEKQQSSLLDLMQEVMGTSQRGTQSSKTRVRGLELALDDIPYELVVSNGRITNPNVPHYLEHIFSALNSGKGHSASIHP